MKKLLLLAGIVPTLSAICFGWMGFGGGVDYSRDSGNTYYCASTATAVSFAGIGVSSPTLILWNPPGSGKNMVVLDAGINVNVSPAAAVGFVMAFSTGIAVPSTSTIANLSGGMITTALISKSTTTSVGYCLLNTNLPTIPRPFRYLGSITGASAISGVQLLDPTQGKVVVPPGVAISIHTTSAASVTAHILEREEPL